MDITGPLFTSDSAVTGSDHTSSPESHPMMLALATPGASRSRLSSALDLSAGEGEGSVKLALHPEKDAPYPSLATPEVKMADPELPPLSPSPAPIFDVAIASRSHFSLLDVEHTVDYPPSPSHGQHDIV